MVQLSGGAEAHPPLLGGSGVNFFLPSSLTTAALPVHRAVSGECPPQGPVVNPDLIPSLPNPKEKDPERSAREGCSLLGAIGAISECFSLLALSRSSSPSLL